LKQIQSLSAKFNKDVIVSEVGVKTNANATLAAQVLNEFVTGIKAIDKCKGIFYWEPEVDGKWKPAVYGSLGWNAYDMGAFTTGGKATGVMDAFK
jgi:arabinogalactan endo-1,4-beta-galactosidase